MQGSTSIIAKVKKWTEEHKEEVKQRKTKYARENRDAISFTKILYEEANPELIKKQEVAHHEKEIAEISNWTKELREEAKIYQNNTCILCGASPSKKKALASDHDHSTGYIRGLLCDKCNRGLGLFNDDPVLLKKASDYINFYKEHGAIDTYIPFQAEEEDRQ